MSGPGLREILRVLGKWKAVVVLVVVAAVGTSGVYSYFVLPKVYQATATIDVAQLLSPTVSSGGGGGQASNLQGVVNAVTSQPTMTMSTLLFEIGTPAILDVASKSLATQGVSLSAGALGGMVRAAEIGTTDFLTISGTNNDPRVAAAVANAVAEAVVSQETASTNGHSAQALQLLQSQAAQVKAQLDAATAALALAEQQPGAATSTSSVIATDSQQLAALSSEYAQAQVDLQSAQAAENSIQASMAGLSPTITTTSGSASASAPQPNPLYQSISQQLASDQVQLAVDKAKAQVLYQQELQYSYAVQPAQYTAAQQAYDTADVTVKGDEAAISALQAQLAQTPATLAPQTVAAPTSTTAPNPAYAQLNQQLQGQQVTVASDQAKLNALAQQIPPLKQQLATINQESTAADATVAAAQSKVSDLTSTYQTLEQNITKTQVEQALAGGGSPVQVDTPAAVPGAPIAPRKKRNVALAFLIGLVAGCGLAFLLEQFDNTIKSPEDVRRVSGLPTLAVIPIVRP